MLSEEQIGETTWLWVTGSSCSCTSRGYFSSVRACDRPMLFVENARATDEATVIQRSDAVRPEPYKQRRYQSVRSQYPVKR